MASVLVSKLAVGRLAPSFVKSHWASSDTQKCFMEYFDFSDGKWRPVAKREIGPMNTCYDDIDANGP